MDIDECSEGRANCPRGRLCVNTPVSVFAIGSKLKSVKAVKYLLLEIL